MIKLNLFLILGVLMLSNCRSDEPLTENTQLDFIVGTWDVTSVEYETFLGGVKIKSGTGSVSGTITFLVDGTGFEDYTITIDGTTEVKDGNFFWENEGAFVTFDKGTEFETTWEWLVNEENLQVTKFDYQVGPTISEVKVTLTN